MTLTLPCEPMYRQQTRLAVQKLLSASVEKIITTLIMIKRWCLPERQTPITKPWVSACVCISPRLAEQRSMY